MPAPARLKGSLKVERPDKPKISYYPRTLSLTAIAGIGRLAEVSLPLAEVGGVPVGLSLLAAHGRDAYLLGVVQLVAARSGPCAGKLRLYPPGTWCTRGEIRSAEIPWKNPVITPKKYPFPPQISIFRKNIFCRKFVLSWLPLDDLPKKRETFLRLKPGWRCPKIIFLQWPAA